MLMRGLKSMTTFAMIATQIARVVLSTSVVIVVSSAREMVVVVGDAARDVNKSAYILPKTDKSHHVINSLSFIFGVARTAVMTLR